MLRTLALAALKFVPATDSCAASFFPGCSTIESTAIVLLGNQGVDLIDSSGGTHFLGAVAPRTGIPPPRTSSISHDPTALSRTRP